MNNRFPAVGNISDPSKVRVALMRDGQILNGPPLDNAGAAILEAATDASNFGFVIDEDDMASDSDTKVPTQQSVKAYVAAATVTVPKATLAAASSYTPASAPSFIRTAGYSSAGDGGAGLYKKVTSEPSHDGKLSITLSDGTTVVWYELVSSIVVPQQFGAIGYEGTRADFKTNIGTATDDSTALQSAIDYLEANGGGTLWWNRFHLANTPIELPYGVSILGIGPNSCGIYKDSTTTKTVTYYDSAALAQTAIYPGSLPTDANACLILSKADGVGRWIGQIKGITIGSTLATAADYETQKAEFGILSIGSLSDFEIDGNYFENCQYAALLPTPFVGQLTNNRISFCLHGFGIGNGTTLTMYGNYVNTGRDYGYAFRVLKYSKVFANACDGLNDPTIYPDRTRECSAYVVNSCYDVDFECNGQEGTWGNGWNIDTIYHCRINNNILISLGSDYAGTEHIAIWKIQGAVINSEIIGNNGYSEKPGGIIQGSADAAKHHNIYVVPGTLTNGSSIYLNVFRDAANGTGTEAGWLNNVSVNGLVVRDGGIYTRSAADSTYGNILQGTGATPSTYSLDVRNGSASSLLRLRDDGYATAPGVYSQTIASAANVYVHTDGGLYRSTSALKYKDVIGPIPDDMIDKVMAITGFIYSQKGDETKRRLVGLAADHFHDAGLTEFVHYGADGEPEGLMYERIVAVTMEAHRRLAARVTALEEAPKA